MKLSDYCDVPKSVDLTQEEENAFLQEIVRMTNMKPMHKEQGKFNAEALNKLIEAVSKESYNR